MGIIELPDNAHEKGETTLEDKLVRWISLSRIPIVTGNFGKNNQLLIASTAVAARATVGCRIRTFFVFDERHWALGDGFLIFGDCHKLKNQISEAGPDVFEAHVGEDLIDDIEKKEDDWAIAKGPKETIPSVHGFIHKKTHWDKEVFGTKQCRVFVGSSRPCFKKKNQSGGRGNGSAVATMAAARRMAVERTDRRP